MPSQDPSNPEHDLVVFGATSFVGKLTAKYLAENAPADAKIALAGRSQEKLEQVRSNLPGGASEWPLIIADSTDRDSLERMVAATRAVITTVGPYQEYGMPLVEACAQSGTNYADLTGEVLFIRESIDAAHGTAEANGARIVHTCGFDSIPSDLGVHLLHRYAAEHDLGDLGETTMVVKATRGGVSGGTVASLRGQIIRAREDRSALKTMTDPYSLTPNPSAEPDRGESDPKGVSHDSELGGYLAPFIMGTINSRVVRRSNALRDHAYGKEFRYRELMAMGELPLGPVKAAGVVTGIGAVVAGYATTPTRKLLDRLLPDPGEGPDESSREKGFFKIETHAETSSGQKLVCKIGAQGDPGYKATAVMLGEAGLALALDGDALPDHAGVLTPSTGIGDRLLERLRDAGHTYEVERA
ncbi:MAG: saccharopine dehydrogenase family protein [Solirubrobacterales bacterium]